MKRYELPTPPAGKMTDIQAWNECVENSMAQLEHQKTRILNLELMLEYGGESWKVYNEVLVELLNKVGTYLPFYLFDLIFLYTVQKYYYYLLP